MEEVTTCDVLASAAVYVREAALRRSATDAIVVACKVTTASVLLTALHAFAQAIGLRDLDDVREWKWEDAPERVRQLCERVWDWEDRPGRTTDHVLRALDRAREGLA